MYVSLLLALVIIGNTAVLLYTAPTSAGNRELLNRIEDLKDQIETLNDQSRSTISNLEEQLQVLDLRLQNIQVINNTGTTLLTTLYNITKASVVSIENRVRSGSSKIIQGLGSGFVYNTQGYIVTNNHVVEGADELVVKFIDGNYSTATIVGTDPYSDLAIIMLDTSMPWLKALPIGNSSTLRVGESVVALGSPFGLSSTMTAGIVSHIGRDMEAPSGYRIVDVVQHDVSINPGNSGGPLINLMGEVVGINTAIASQSGTSSGVGFAIPSNTIAREAQDLITKGTYEHPYLGVRGMDNNPDIAEAAGLNVSWGFLITEIVSGGPASQAGLRGGIIDKVVLGQRIRVGGDLIIAVDSYMVLDLSEISVYIERQKRPGDELRFTMSRNGNKIYNDLTLGIRPPP